MKTANTADRRGNPENLNPQFAELAEALAGIDLPQKRDALQQQAKQNGADENTSELIAQLPDREYETMAEIIQAAGDIMETSNDNNA